MHMDDYKGAGNGNVNSSYVGDDDFIDRPNATKNLDLKYLGSPADKHDMSILGRDQVLRVSMLHTLLSTVLSIDNFPRSATFASSPLLASVVRLSARGRSS